MTHHYDPNTDPLTTQRLPDRERDDQWARSFLASQRIGHFGVIWQGQPLVMPLLYWVDEPANRVILHCSPKGRLAAAIHANPQVCLEVSRAGKMLPSNVALNFTIQYECVMAFGDAAFIEGRDEKRAALQGLLDANFPELVSGEAYRPITDEELDATGVISLTPDAITGKVNWPDHAKHVSSWPPKD